MVKVFFHETQAFSQIRKLLVLAITLVAVGFVALMVYLKEWDTMPAEEKPFLLFLLAGPLASLVVFLIHVDLRITGTSLGYAIRPFRRRHKEVPMEEIESFEITLLKGATRFRSSGVTYRTRNKEMYFGGSHLFKVHLKNGSYLLFGTSRPKELEHFLTFLAETGPKLAIKN